MKHPKAYVISLLALAACAANDGGGQPSPVPPKIVATLSWDHSGLDLNGLEIVISDAEAALTTPEEDLNHGGLPLSTISMPAKVGHNEQDATELIEGAPDGRYRMWLRVRSTGNIPSAWAQSQEFTLPKS